MGPASSMIDRSHTHAHPPLFHILPLPVHPLPVLHHLNDTVMNLVPLLSKKTVQISSNPLYESNTSLCLYLSVR